jgi:hypothetical protein
LGSTNVGYFQDDQAGQIRNVHKRCHRFQIPQCRAA